MANESEPNPRAGQHPRPPTSSGEPAWGGTEAPPAGDPGRDGTWASADDDVGGGGGGTGVDAADADAAVVDDPDEPVNPDEAAVAEAEAARSALSPTAHRRPYRGPRSLLIMLFVVAAVVATGVYAVLWYQRIKEADDRGDLRRLEEREAMARFQRRSTLLRFGPDANVLPAGAVYEPPTPAERGRMWQLQQRFGPNQFKPDDKQAMLIQEVREMEAARGLPPTSLDVTVKPPGEPPRGGTPPGSPATGVAP